MTHLRRALDFAEAGISIFPVELPALAGSGGRNPTSLIGLIAPAPTPTLLRAGGYVGHWQCRAFHLVGWDGSWLTLIVIPGKPDGVAALAELGGLPPHPVVKTAGGGEHHFFRQPALPVADNHALAGNGIDVLGTSRFVVG